MADKDIFLQTSINQAKLQSTGALDSWATGITSDYRTYNPSNSKYPTVAPTRSSVVDPQKGISNISGTGRYSARNAPFANSSQITTATANRISYLTPSGSRPNAYWWGQLWDYSNPTKALFANQAHTTFSFFRFSDGNKVIMDQFTNDNPPWIYYNQTNLDSNLLTISNIGSISKIEQTGEYKDNTDTPVTPLLFQTHGGMGPNNSNTMNTDYPRDAHWQANDLENYIIYRSNFGSNVELPTNMETEGEWSSNRTGERSGS